MIDSMITEISLEAKLSLINAFQVHRLDTIICLTKNS